LVKRPREFFCKVRTSRISLFLAKGALHNPGKECLLLALALLVPALSLVRQKGWERQTASYEQPFWSERVIN
jgi:hypothetical protein